VRKAVPLRTPFEKDLRPASARHDLWKRHT